MDFSVRGRSVDVGVVLSDGVSSGNGIAGLFLLSVPPSFLFSSNLIDKMTSHLSLP